LSNSWWPGAVISEERATTEAQRQQQALLDRLATLSAEKAVMMLRLSTRYASKFRR
jgi:hypothetical protein